MRSRTRCRMELFRRDRVFARSEPVFAREGIRRRWPRRGSDPAQPLARRELASVAGVSSRRRPLSVFRSRRASTKGEACTWTRRSSGVTAGRAAVSIRIGSRICAAFVRARRQRNCSTSGTAGSSCDRLMPSALPWSAMSARSAFKRAGADDVSLLDVERVGACARVCLVFGAIRDALGFGRSKGR